MALELVGGTLLSVFLNVAFEKLASPQILDFFRTRKLDEELLNKLKTKLNSIHSLVDDAERKQFTNPHVKNWLLEVKDAVLDAEDLLDDLQMLYKRQVDADSESQTSACCTFKVLNFFKSSPISSYNKEIESRMQKVLDKLDTLLSQRGNLGLKTVRVVGSGLSNELPQKSQTTSLVVGTDIYGRDDDKKQIVDWLISDTNNSNQPSILSIVGMGGVGKTTLAQHVFNDPNVDEAKFDVKAWVCVSDEFDVFKVSRAILEAITKSTDDSRDLEMVHTRLKEQLTKKKFLLVLDDLWNENKPKWEELQKPLMFGVQGSKIIVTTRSKEVASTMRSEVHSLKQLQEDDCWNLFVKYAFKDDDTQQNLECTEIGKKIVEKCKGLPLALKTMGSLLYNKSSVSEWESVFQNEIWEFSQERCDIIPALALSYIHLPSHLKVCFAYCALFPKDYEFKKEHLMHLWMTENLLHYPSENFCKQYFNDLLSRSFFQQSGEKEEVFVMHDLLNDLAKYVGGGIYFRWEVNQEGKIQKVTRHFSVEVGYNQYFDGFGTSCNTKRLRTFMSTGLGKLKNLKVVMESFNVGHGREFGIQQLGELNLDGSLSIKALENIENSVDASEAYLKNKTLLVKLKLRWTRNRDSIDSKKEEEVIKNLQPSENLKELVILHYGGKEFPNWLHSLLNLVSLELNGCDSCERLPPLGLLPFLEDLNIIGLDGIVSIDADFYGSNSSSFKSLQNLRFFNMGQWKKWECKAGIFPNLQTLYISDCPKLKGELPEQLVPLKKYKLQSANYLRLPLQEL
ncbi:putative disease resistance RPP13-like protein 1 [Vigna unguiculata]|uniref:putative disease resistance RPP13-like protein 1 n=1 Tax=Vigna unguiculata TaxID=3917 RepID=UPI001016BB7B|nr:putative disease resistance RPP13-like protein 1 [Vigna unguiculata]